MQHEIEVKVKVTDFQALLAKLTDLGCELTEPVVQDDTIFINYDRPFIDFKKDDVFLRIRKTKGKTIFTFKKGEEMNSVEREFEVSDAEQLHDTLVFLGFRPEVSVRKTRRKGNIGGYEICLDEVEGLGAFVELEKITERQSEVVQGEMMKFLEGLGVETSGRVVNGYDTLVWMEGNGR